MMETQLDRLTLMATAMFPREDEGKNLCRAIELRPARHRLAESPAIRTTALTSQIATTTPPGLLGLGAARLSPRARHVGAPSGASEPTGSTYSNAWTCRCCALIGVLARYD